jgi:hypothetical protein
VNNFYISPSVWSWINFVFFLKYPPELLQKEITLTEKNEYGLAAVPKFDQYYLGTFPNFQDADPNSMYVGKIEDFPPKIQAIHTVYYPDKKPAFMIVSYEALVKECSRLAEVNHWHSLCHPPQK